MSDLNNLCITARLTKDSVQRTFTSGTAYLNFEVVNNTGFGEHAKVNYFKCILIGKRAEALVQYLHKGKLVAINGVLEKNDWTNNEGKLVKDWQITVSDIILLGGKDKPEQGDLFDDEGMGDELKRQAKSRASNPFGKRAKDSVSDAEVVF